MQKKAQGGINAAVLVAIIAGLIILYIIFLPTSERERLLTEKEGGSGSNIGKGSNIILRVNPGTLSISDSLESEKSIPDIFLVETTNAFEIKRINPFIVRNGLFDKRANTANFELNDPSNTDNVVLTFASKKRQGTLTIKLNGVVVFENDLATDNPEPVKLDKNLLKSSNALEFSVSSVGARFWTSNEYSFDNVRIIGDITDTSRQESTNIFTISDSEYSSMEKATLKFIPFCSNLNDVGTLDIYINSKKLYSTVPVCDNPYMQSIPKSAINQGENNIVFKTKKGSYSVDQIRISLGFKDARVKTYYFELNESLFKAIKEGKRDIMLSIKFVDDKSQKSAKLDVNGHMETIDTTKSSYSKDIANRVLEGNNYIRIEPFEDLEVVELKVELV